MNKIIFIEGVSGVGKSTTTTLLYDKLRSMGYEASRYLEGDADNPLDPYNGTYPPKLPFAEFSETYSQCWRDFAKKQFRKDFMLVDGTLLHHQINDLIREYAMPNEAIADYLSSLLNIIQHLNPVIFYLSSDDVGKRLAQARESRKQSVPTGEQIAFWENRKRVDLCVLDKLPVELHILNVGVKVLFCGVQRHVKDFFDRAGVSFAVGEDNFFWEAEHALKSLNISIENEVQ
jgi:hypothetical protein